MGEWKEVKLGDCIEVNYGKDHKKLKEGKYPCFGSGGIMRYVDKFLYNSSSILIPRKGSLNNIMFQSSPFWTVDTMFWSKIDESIIVPKFLFYQMLLIDYSALNVGSAVPSLTVPVIKEIQISYPPFPEQKAIAEVLSSLDDKIDLLHRQNKTLEQMAETLFRQWFVEEAKEDWEEGVLGDLVDVKYGKDHKKLLEGSIPVYGSGGIMRYTEKALFVGESVLIPRKGTLNNVIYVNESFWTVDTMFYTIMKQPNLAKFIYYFVKEKDLASMNVGSAVPSMTTQVLNNMPLQIPFNQDLENFENTVTPFHQKIKANKNQIRILEKIRDTLLPKLMRRDVRVIVEPCEE